VAIDEGRVVGMASGFYSPSRRDRPQLTDASLDGVRLRIPGASMVDPSCRGGLAAPSMEVSHDQNAASDSLATRLT
jgi:hypothetical protein